MIKTILICQYPMPYRKIASWTNMYNYYLKECDHRIDGIVCPYVKDQVDHVTYSFYEETISVTPNFIEKVKNKIGYENRFEPHIRALEKLIKKDEKYVLKIIDNSGLAIAIDQHLINNYERENFHLLYYFQGFAPLFERSKSKDFIYAIDEMLFLTALAYKEWCNYYDDSPYRARVFHNACDTNRFKQIEKHDRQILREKYDINTELVFIWCSQDRPKKGLHLILDVWKLLPDSITNKASLLVVGVEKEISIKGVQVIGRVPNQELAKYYQLSDFYLFPSLWKEGFGIVLAEALHCGCYCIASANGGIPEVLQHGKLGKLVHEPNMIYSWVSAIEESVKEYEEKGNPYLKNFNDQIYNLKNWSDQMNTIIESAKGYLN